MTGEDPTSGGPTPRGRVGSAPPALVVGVIAWFVLGVLELVASTGTWPGRESDPGVESLRNQMGSEVASTGGSAWPNLAGLALGVGLLAGAVLLLLGSRWTRPALPVVGIVVIIALGTVGWVEVAIGLGLFVIATVATMTVGPPASVVMRPHEWPSPGSAGRPAPRSRLRTPGTDPPWR